MFSLDVKNVCSNAIQMDLMQDTQGESSSHSKLHNKMKSEILGLALAFLFVSFGEVTFYQDNRPVDCQFPK